MNKIGTLDIIKAYLGIKELSANNAYFGEYPLINGAPIIDDRLRFEALEDNTVIGLAKKSTVYNILQYSLDGNNWNDLTTSTSITLNTGDEMFIRGKMTANGTNDDYNNFSISGKVEVKGKIMYLYDYENIESNIVYTYTFRRLFLNCSGLIDARNLIFPNILPDYCCSGMFNTCDNLLYAPELSATIIGPYCYWYMFENCSRLASAPELSATTLADYCCSYMFYNCTSLSTAPTELPATTLADFCYLSMFRNCSSLTIAPELPATTLALSCYSSMFRGCSDLASAPELPATTLANYCYNSMFNSCYSLTSAPTELPATTLASYCYLNMFYNCSSLTSAPELPATTLANGCYSSMFYGCSSLTSAPELPATTLANGCYSSMFYGCSSLTYIKCLATITTANNCLNTWVAGVSSTGTFERNSTARWELGNSGIPSVWTITPEAQPNYFKFISRNNNSIIKMICHNVSPNLQYSKDSGATWTQWDYSEISILNGEEVWFKGNNPNGIGSNYSYYAVFKSNNQGELDVAGDIMTLCDNGTNIGKTIVNGYAFSYLFYEMGGGDGGMRDLYNANNLILSATTLSSNCYAWMFNGCSNLITAPALPATTLASNCYEAMFRLCTSLTTSPELPATTLANECYKFMFLGCTNLNKVTTYCIGNQSTSTYQSRFANWLSGVSSTGDFYNLGNATFATGISGIPSGWTTHTSL